MKFENIPKVKLEENEKKVQLNKLLDFIEKNPVRKSAGRRLIDWRYTNFRKSLTLSNMYTLLAKPLSILVSVFITMGSGTALAAQESAPGDLLYTYKIGINENVRSWLAISNESKAKLSMDISKERLKEAEKLAAKGKLDAEKSDYLESEFNSNMLEGYDNLGKMRDDDKTEDADKIESDFKSDLKLHEEALLEIKGDSDAENSIQIQGILNLIKPETPDVEGAAQGKLNAAENKLSSTIKFIENKSESIDAETKAAADAKLEISQSLITEGKAELEEENYSAAFDSFEEAFKTSQEAKAIVNGGTEADIDVETETDTDEDEDEDEDKEKSKLDVQLDVEV